MSAGHGSDPIPFRRHHFLCALGFAGEGYSDIFTANLARIVEGLRAPEGAGTQIIVVATSDAICAPCPLRRGSGCESGTRIEALDRAHGAALGLSPGDRLSWGEAQARMRERVAPGALDDLCAGCQWLSFGLCAAALERLHDGGRAAWQG